MTIYLIDRNVPIPERKNRTCATNKAARSMEIGDSILVEFIPNYSYASNMTRATGFKFTQRKVEGGLRIWRIA